MTVLLMTTSDARAGTLESLVMPGKVIEGHAEVESECSSCHQKFDRGAQQKLCVVCHEDVGADLDSSTGFHGRDPSASSMTCASCHTDHEGRDATIVKFDEATFDHRFTDFELLGKHADVQCESCHVENTLYREAPGQCIDCHQADDAHETFLGESCQDCHTVESWLDAEFDHDLTDYPLLGAHASTGCLDCHADSTFQNAPTTCVGCHKEDDAHDGRSGDQCDRCHNTVDWTDTTFDHNRDTLFGLTGGHADLNCTSCHSDDPFSDRLERTCVSCHEQDDAHDRHFGPNCETCHSDEEWESTTFDHATDTGFILAGAHRDATCESCHVEPVFEVALAEDCYSCHAADDVHKGQEGEDCQTCHNEIGWLDQVLFDHDFTAFPLLGNHAEVECQSCHETQAFLDAPSACVDCHADEDPHDNRFTPDCATCHTPVDWENWRFDHNRQSDFALSGAHAEVSCNSCHRQSLTAMKGGSQSCGSCHRADDVHDGEFGEDCARCHSADSFRDVRAIR